MCVILFLAGILLSFYSLSRIAAFLLIILAGYSVKKDKARLFAVALIIILLGGIRMDIAKIHQRKIVSQHLGKSGQMSLVITRNTTDGKAIARLLTENGNIGVYMTQEESREFSCGDIVTGNFKLEAPYRSKNSGSSFKNYLSSLGVYLMAQTEDAKITGTYNKGITGKIYTLRRNAASLSKSLFRGDKHALFNAMVLGDKSLLSDELYASLQGSGLNHIAVVSGMHLSVVIAMLIFIVRKILGKGRRGFVVAIAGAVFITLFTGAGASVVRALVMCIIYYISRLLYRENDGLTTVGLTFMIMAVINPFIIFNTGFVLSILSVLGIVLFGRNFSALFRLFMPCLVADAIALTVSVQLLLTPLIVYYFGVVTPYAPMSNIIAVPLSSLYVILGMLLCVISPIKPLAAAIAFVLNFLAQGIINLCDGVSSLPSALIKFNGEFIPFAVGWIGLTAIIYLRHYKDKNSKYKI